MWNQNGWKDLQELALRRRRISMGVVTFTRRHIMVHLLGRRQGVEIAVQFSAWNDDIKMGNGKAKPKGRLHYFVVIWK